MSENQESKVVTEVSMKNGEENFNEEIKDYAKTTMNELLGMFGYDEEITSESVDNLEIKVPQSSEKSTNSLVTTTTTVSSPSSVAMATTLAILPRTTASVTMTPSLPVTVADVSMDDTPVIVKVEGNTSVSDIISQQNAASTSPNSTTQGAISKVSPPQPPATKNIAVIVPPDSNGVPNSCQSETGQPSLAPHFYAVPPAVRGLYCVVANLPLVVNQSKSAMTFKFWNCITCSEYFLQKPEIVFRVDYPHLFNGQPEWLYQAALCNKCYQSLISSVAPLSGTASDLSSKATYKVIDCKIKESESNAAPGSVAHEVVVETSTSTVRTKDVVMETLNGDKNIPEDEEITAPKTELFQCEDICEDTESSEENPTGENSAEENSAKENPNDSQESYKCYACQISVSVTSRQGKLRRSKFPSLFMDVPGNVGHFKVCYMCFDRLNRQRDRYIQANVPDEERDYMAHIKVWNGAHLASKSCSSYAPNVCFICEAGLNAKDPSRPIFRSRYPTLFRGLPHHVIHLPICDLCYRKLQKIKLRFDSGQQDEDTRNYVQFVNMWRAKRGLGQHPVLV